MLKAEFKVQPYPGSIAAGLVESGKQTDHA